MIDSIDSDAVYSEETIQIDLKKILNLMCMKKCYIEVQVNILRGWVPDGLVVKYAREDDSQIYMY